MSVPVSPLVQYVQSDGRLTTEGLRLLASILSDHTDIEARVAALEVTSADHETRITTLEP